MINYSTIKILIIKIMVLNSLHLANCQELYPIDSTNVLSESEDIVEDVPGRDMSTFSDNCFYFYNNHTDGWDKKIGIACDNQTILPAIFNIKYFNQIKESQFLILGFANRYGVFDIVGQNWILSPEYENISSYSDVFVTETSKKITALVDQKGNILIEPNINYVAPLDYKKRYLLVKKSYNNEDVYGVFDTELFKHTINQATKIITNSNHPEPIIVNKNGEGFDLFALDGKRITNESFEKIKTNYGIENAFTVSKNGRYGAINNYGHTILDFKYDSINVFQSQDKTYFTTTDSNKKLTIRNDKNEQIFDQKLDAIIHKKNRFFIVEKNEKFGLLEYDENGVQLILPINYDTIGIDYYGILTGKDNQFNFQEDIGKVISKDLPYGEFRTLINGEKLVFKGNYIYPFNKSTLTINEDYQFVNIEEIDVFDYQAANIRYSPTHFKAQLENKDYVLLDKEFKQVSNQQFKNVYYLYKNYIFYGNENGKIGVFDTEMRKIVVLPIFNQVFLEDNNFIFQKGEDYYLMRDKKIVKFR